MKKEPVIPLIESVFGKDAVVPTQEFLDVLTLHAVKNYGKTPAIVFQEGEWVMMGLDTPDWSSSGAIGEDNQT